MVLVRERGAVGGEPVDRSDVPAAPTDPHDTHVVVVATGVVGLVLFGVEVERHSRSVDAGVGEIGPPETDRAWRQVLVRSADRLDHAVDLGFEHLQFEAENCEVVRVVVRGPTTCRV